MKLGGPLESLFAPVRLVEVWWVRWIHFRGVLSSFRTDCLGALHGLYGLYCRVCTGCTAGSVGLYCRVCWVVLQGLYGLYCRVCMGCTIGAVWVVP